jgi:PPOX class probable F420-dependent enzyme
VRDLAALHVEHRWHYRRVVIDPTTEKGARVHARLRDEQVAWLVTVAADGTPVPTPVWWWWDGATILVYSEPDRPKLRHIVANPRVAIALRTDPDGHLLAVVTGEARLDPDAPTADAHAEYAEKYGAAIERLGYTAEQFAGAYSVAVRVTPTKLRAW